MRVSCRSFHCWKLTLPADCIVIDIIVNRRVYLYFKSAFNKQHYSCSTAFRMRRERFDFVLIESLPLLDDFWTVFVNMWKLRFL